MHCIPGQFINPACIQIHHMHQQIPKHHSSQLLLCDGAHLNFRPRLCVYEQVPCLFLPEHYQLSSSWQCCDGLPLQLYRDAHDFMCISLTCVVLTAIGVVDDHWCWRPLVLALGIRQQGSACLTWWWLPYPQIAGGSCLSTNDTLVDSADDGCQLASRRGLMMTARRSL